jgi:hypothetical protein
MSYNDSREKRFATMTATQMSSAEGATCGEKTAPQRRLNIHLSKLEQFQR